MDSSGKLNLDVIPQYYNMLKNNGIAGAFINGSTGEGVSLSDDEKYRVAAAWAGATTDDADFKVINLVGGTSIAQSQQQAAYTQQLGLYGIAFTAPITLNHPLPTLWHSVVVK
ncbi:dihydrodipicolinate synthase family protein [Niabella sp. W65]|nr:dihydrodipicolinate synthase family protein [Niabella sp. W65]MCH7363548.1 dihydrodipicolinate synthase family protein [Niabella sp. W65]